MGFYILLQSTIFFLRNQKMAKDNLITIFLKQTCLKRERYYICRLKVLRFGEVAQLVRAHDS